MTFMTFLFISLCYCHKALEWPTCQEEGKVYSLHSQSTITWLAHCFKASGGIGHHSGDGMAPHGGEQTVKGIYFMEPGSNGKSA